ncbi:MAG: TniQ family protein [Thiomonas sp.]|nr:TniQ family protein [Thiomonas sp.]
MLIDCPPIAAGEALNGYLLRLAERNGLAGIRHLLEPLAIKVRAAYSVEQISRIANFLDCDRQALLDANLVNSRSARPDTNGHFAPDSRLPVCPICFAEEPIIRREWLNVMSPVCARHGVRLVDHCATCEAPMTWRRMGLSQCDCGAELTSHPAVNAPEFATALSCAIHGHPIPEGLSAQIPTAFVRQGPDQSDSMAWFFACHAADPGGTRVMKRPRPANTDEAIAFLETNLAPVFADWPRGLHRLLGSIDAASPDQSAGVRRQLKNWYRGMVVNFNQDRFQWLHDEVAQFVAEHLAITINARTSSIPGTFGEIKGWLSVAEAARVIGVAPDRLRTALRDGDVAGEVRRGGADRDFAFLRRELVDEIRRQRAQYVEARKAMTMLDVTKRQLKRLVDAGGVIHHEASDRPALVDAPYREDELLELLSRIEARHQPWPSARHGCPIALAEIQAVRGRGEDYVLRAYRAILRGDVVAREIRQGAIGMSRFVFDADELNVVALPNPHDARMTLTQLCDMTGWKHESVAKWIANGFLKAERIANGPTMTTLIRVDDLVFFLSRHVILAVMARECGGQSSDLVDLIEGQGCDVHSFHYEGRRGKFGSIVALEDLGALLQEVCRPDRFRG